MQQLALLVILAIISVNGQDYSKIPKWADFGFYGNLGFKELDHKLEFSMDNYEFISIEKCTGNGGGKTVRYFIYKFVLYWFIYVILFFFVGGLLPQLDLKGKRVETQFQSQNTQLLCN